MPSFLTETCAGQMENQDELLCFTNQDVLTDDRPMNAMQRGGMVIETI